MSKDLTSVARPPPEARIHSYRRILAATSILGGASAVNILIGMVRSKAVALLLGPTGVGVMGTYQSLTTMVSTISCMGLNTSGVREVAAAKSLDDKARLAATLTTFCRMNIALAIAGALVLIVLARPLASLTFGSSTHTLPIICLSAVVFFSVMNGYNSAVLQGWHHIGKVAKVNVISAVVGALVAISLFWLLGDKGIVPALISGGAIQWGISWYFTRSLGLQAAMRGGTYSQEVAASLLKIGWLFLFFGIAGAGAAYVQRLVIVRDLGEVAAGMFQAASSLSVIYASYVLNSMSTDFLPRLSAVADDGALVNNLVNEQTVVAVLLALPGIVATNVFAQLAILIFYSSEFQPAVVLLQLLAAGIFGKIVSWPVGIVLVAKKRVRASVIMEVLYHMLFFAVLISAQPALGLTASGLAPIVGAVLHLILLTVFVHRETGFTYDARSRKVLLVGLLTVGGSLASALLVPAPWNWFAGGLLLAFSCWFSYRTLSLAADFTIASALAKVFTTEKKAA